MAKSPATNEMTPGCAVVFCAVFFLAGSVFLVLMAWKLVIPEWLANHSFVEHTCEILDKRVVETAGEDGPTYRAEFLIGYSVDGQDYQVWTYDASRISSSGRSGKERILEQFTVGQRYPCWYDPEDPNQSVLVLGYSWFLYLFLLIPLVFVAFGAFGIRYFWLRRGKSLELLAAPASQSVSADAGQLNDPFPSVPKVKTDKYQGSKLTYRLPLATWQSWWTVAVFLVVVLFWNGLVSLFVGAAIGGYLKGDRLEVICLTLFLVPFVLVGVALIVALLRMVLVTAICRPARVEIAAHPLTPGESTLLHIAQRGPLPLLDMTVTVACEEVAKYTKGEDYHTDKKRIHEDEVTWQADTAEWQGEFQIPASAMHSFKATHNAIQWKILIQGKAAGWLEVEWEYPFVVRPSSPAKEIQ